MHSQHVYSAAFVPRNIKRALKLNNNQNNLKMAKMTEQTSPNKN